MKIKKIVSLFLIISALFICMGVVSANETTQDYIPDEVQQIPDTSSDIITTYDDIKTETIDNFNNEIVTNENYTNEVEINDKNNVISTNNNSDDKIEINKNSVDKTVKTDIDLNDFKNIIDTSAIGNVINTSAIGNIINTTDIDNVINTSEIKNIINSIDMNYLTDISDIIKSNIEGISNNIRGFSGQNFSFTIKIPSIGNISENIPTAVLKINGKTLAKSKVINGSVSFNFTVPSLKEGKHVLTIKVDYGLSFERNITLEIYKRNVSITTDKKASFAGENVTVKANVTTDNFNVIYDKAILKIAGKTLAKANVINGVATFKFTTPDLREGTYDMVIKTGPNTLYNEANATQKFSVYRNNLTIKAEDMTGFAGQKATINANFYTDGVKNINNIPAVLKVNGNSVAKSTIKEGVAIFYFNVPTIKKGSYDLFIKVGESTFYNAANVTKKLTVLSQNITITTGTVKGYAGQGANLIANFVSSDNKKVNITKSVLKINGKTLANNAVVNGVANYSFTIPKVDAGNYTLTIKTGDTTLYNSATKTTKLTVL